MAMKWGSRELYEALAPYGDVKDVADHLSRTAEFRKQVDSIKKATPKNISADERWHGDGDG